MARILLAGVVYFGLTFGAGFVFGAIRVSWVVPRTGARLAELLEAPLMLAVIVFAARWVVHRFGVRDAASARLGMGGTALGLLVATEIALVLGLRGVPLDAYLASRDPVAAAVYYVLLGVFAAMPLVVGRRALVRRKRL